MSNAQLTYIRIDSSAELIAWFLCMFSDTILNAPLDKQEMFARKIGNIDFMRLALETYIAINFDTDALDIDFLSIL